MKRSSRPQRAAALAISLAVVLAACGSDDEPAADETVPTTAASTDSTVTTTADTDGSDDTTATTEAGAPADTASDTTEPAEEASNCDATVAGTSITAGMLTEPTGLDPVNDSNAGTTGGTHMAAIYDALMRWDPETGEYQTHMAESLESDADYTVWTLGLRDGVNFSDGTPLNADAVVTSIGRYADSPFGGFAYNLLDSVVATDDLTVTFTLTGPWSGFPFLLASSFGYVTNQAAVDAGGDGFSLNPVGAGAGPYVIDRFSPGEGVYLKANPDYWGGPVCVESLSFVRIPGGPATYEAYTAGQLQLAFLREPIAIAQATADGESMLGWQKNAGTVLMMNNGVGDSSPATLDVRLRRAIDLAVDPEATAFRRRRCSPSHRAITQVSSPTRSTPLLPRHSSKRSRQKAHGTARSTTRATMRRAVLLSPRSPKRCWKASASRSPSTTTRPLASCYV
jgi:ABC-type transport system substrate-binding protein